MCVICMYMYRIYYIPSKRDIRPVISHREEQCLSEAKEVPRVKPEALPPWNWNCLHVCL